MKRLTLIALAMFVPAALVAGRVSKGNGLEYEVIKKGKDNARVAETGKRVQVHYTGWLNQNGKKGKKFDSSVDKRRPFVFALGQGMVIRGWDEGVVGMKIGEKRTLYIPADMGYGSRGAGDDIPPDANLIFDVELLDCE